jgi:hypothetical protein
MVCEGRKEGLHFGLVHHTTIVTTTIAPQVQDVGLADVIIKHFQVVF